MTRHLGLVIEDHPPEAENLREIVASLDCDTKSATNRHEAIELLELHQFCFVLLDLQIRGEPDGIMGHTSHGIALLRSIREKFGAREGSKIWLPVIIVTGNVDRVGLAVELMKEGADDIIEKPVSTTDVAKRILLALAKAGREAHEACAEIVRHADHRSALTVEFRGGREGKRTSVMVNNHKVPLPDSSLKVLLKLAIATLQRAPVHHHELGARPHQGFKAVSRLRELLRPALGAGVNIIQTDGAGRYSLKDDVRVPGCDVALLALAKSDEINRLATTLAEVLTAHKQT
jgi:CheY-like chemotaxis protein